MPYTQVQKLFDAAWGIGRHYYIKAPFVQDISDNAIDILITHFAHVPSPLSLVVFFQKSGAIRRGPLDQTAFGHREAKVASPRQYSEKIRAISLGSRVTVKASARRRRAF
jgi:hypothetical protein